MAIPLEELQAHRARRVDLYVVPPRPRRRVAAAVLFVVVAAGAVGFPVVDAALDAPPPPPFAARPLPAASIARIEPLVLPPRPASRAPAGGIVFVSCTKLWRADPDGSHRRVLVALDGVSSPTFSPDARTVAFVRHGRELWMTAADGSDVTRIGVVGAHDLPSGAYVTGLTWAPTGRELAFAVVTPGADAWMDGSAIWTLDVSTGTFARAGAGWPAPFYVDRNTLGFAVARGREGGTDLFADGKGSYHDRWLSSRHDDLAAAVVPPGWSGNSRNGLAVFRRGDRGLEIAVRRRTWSRAVALAPGPPPGFAFDGRTRPAVAQDASAVLVELLDTKLTPAVGVLDPSTGRWRTIPYAWDPATTPAPTVGGRLDRASARWWVVDLMRFWDRRPGRRALLLAQPAPRGILPFRLAGYVVGPTRRAGGGFVVGVTAYGRGPGGWAYRALEVSLRGRRGRLQTDVVSAGSVTRVRTAGDAVGFMRSVLGPDALVPHGLPDAVLARRSPIGAWAWGGEATATLRLRTSLARSAVAFTAGDEVSLGLACGGPQEPEEVEVAGTSAVVDHLDGTRQVIWPATLDDLDHARYSVYGKLPRATLLRIADATARAQPLVVARD